MNDDELRKFLLNFEETRIASRDNTDEIRTPGWLALRLLTILSIVFWIVGVVSLVGAIFWVELDLLQRAEMKRVLQMEDAIRGAVQIILSFALLFIAAILTVVRTFMAHIVKLRKVNGAWQKSLNRCSLSNEKSHLPIRFGPPAHADWHYQTRAP